MAIRLLSQPTVSVNGWIGVGLFSVGLIGLLGLTLAAIRRWSKPRQATDDHLSTIGRNASIPFALQLTSRMIDLVFAMILYRFLAIETVGAYDFAAIIVVSYFGTIADWGLTVLATHEIVRQPSQAPQTFRTTLWLRLRFAVLALPIAIIFVLIYNGLAEAKITAVGLTREQITVVAILMLTLFPAAISASVTAWLQGHERLVAAAVVNLLTNIGSAAFRLIALVLGFGIIGIASGALAGAVLSALLFWLAMRRFFPDVAWRGPTLPAKPLLKEGYPLLLNSLLMTIFFRFDTILLSAFHGFVVTATYGVAYKLINFTQIVPPIVVNAIFPTLIRRSGDDRAGMSRAYAGTLRMLLNLAFGIAIIATIVAVPLTTWLADKPEYLPGSVYALMITIWYLPGSYLNGLTQYVIIALGKKQAITKAFGLTALVNLGLNIWLIPRYSYFAAATITIISELVLFVPLWLVLRREKITLNLAGLLWRPALSALIAGGVGWLLLAINVYLAGLVTGLIYAAGLWFSGSIGQTERELAARMLKKLRPQASN
ncbi:oligosaccharide flippase family protein [Herpetosiphon giganteus]|uniref:oligosaccharide flippase family protein n=1 Tax=Herpetosiphon giganteus TaxID=2029754 RepID=UPI00195D44B0|nr:O-antigen/teichoic acid export membrane protein [Herpetosiphon giganteus]